LCPRCRLFVEICICNELYRVQNRNHLTLLMHIKELNRLTNSGRLLGLTLERFSMVVKGHINEVFNPELLIKKNCINLILHPAASRVLSSKDSSAEMPINLIIPDGTWRQSNKLLRSEIVLQNIPRVRLPVADESNYQLRKEKNPEHISTYEAASRALGILEGDSIKNELDVFFDLFVRSLLIRSGRISKSAL